VCIFDEVAAAHWCRGVVVGWEAMSTEGGGIEGGGEGRDLGEEYGHRRDWTVSALARRMELKAEPRA